MRSDVEIIQEVLERLEKPTISRFARDRIEQWGYEVIRQHARNYLYWRLRRGYATNVTEDIKDRGFEDFLQEVWANLLEGDEWNAAVRVAFRKTARVLGWRLTSRGWISELRSIPGDEDDDGE